jgi:hypothetical protein
LERKPIGSNQKKELKGEFMVWRIKVYAKVKVVLFFIFFASFHCFFKSLLFKFCENEMKNMLWIEDIVESKPTPSIF